MTSSFQIKQVTVQHAHELSELAKKIYIPHYPYLWNDGGIDWYIHQFAYPLHKIEAELADANNLHYIAYINDQAIGYLKINICTKAKNFDAQNTMELERIYIDMNCIQKGVGSALMQFVIELAKQHQKKDLVLKAMDSAEKALQFYHKHGFEIVSNFRLPDAVFTLMKPEYRGMLILKRPV